MTKRVVSLALLVAHAAAADEMLARATTIGTFFQNAITPATWTVRSRDDLTGPLTEIYDKAKKVSRAHFKGRRVVVKAGGRHGLSNENQGTGLCGNQMLRRVRRHRRDACSTAWRCRFLTARREMT